MKGVFHLAFATSNIERAKAFYRDTLGCPLGRTSSIWCDFNFFGHQLSIHKIQRKIGRPKNYYHPNSAFPARHFGVVLEWKDWHDLESKLKSAGIPFLVEPQIVFQGEVGEQKTMFIEDPDGNAIEFKSFEDGSKIFATE